jgi:hypothetical protein
MKRAREEEESKVDGAPPAATITKEDAALYDRQIRLWGAASQQKIFEARVLVHGMTGVGAEIAKNLVLAGIGEVTVSLNAREEGEEHVFIFFSFFFFFFSQKAPGRRGSGGGRLGRQFFLISGSVGSQSSGGESGKGAGAESQGESGGGRESF